MRKFIFIFVLMIANVSAIGAQPSDVKETGRKTVGLTFLHTSDVHGAVFSYDYLKSKHTRGGLPAIYAYASSLRRRLGDALILTEGGDCLQGQPTAYYSNYVDTTSTHLVAKVMNEMGYVCAVMGNHDIEAGHAVYDRWVKQLDMPVLGANVIDTRTDQPYLTPYIVIEREGARIALLGMVTPTIPFWLPRNLWTNLRFEDVETSSRKWVKHIMEKEHPDLLVGVFHSGFDGGIVTPECSENATERTARNVPGFDFIFYGHDHHAAVHEVTNVEGKVVKCVGPSSEGTSFALAKVVLQYDGGKLTDKQIDMSIVQSAPFANDVYAELFEADFVDERQDLSKWVGKSIGTLTHDMDGMDAYFGPSLFIDFIHQMQLELTGAEVSFAAPLSYNSVIKAGSMTVADMFNLYKYENFLYTMRLTGSEIKGFLEMSYSKWVEQMHSADDHIMLMKQNEQGDMYFPNMTFNFDSAAGIQYTVDVTKPVGERIHISGMADGTAFDMNKEYKVAVNSYRGNGGGELLTQGAGIPREELSSRIITASDVDQRLLMMQRIQQLGTVTPRLLNTWRFVPEEWAVKACERDRKLLMK